MKNGPGTNYFAPIDENVSAAFTTQLFGDGFLAVFVICNDNPNTVALHVDTYANGCFALRNDIGSGNNIYTMTGTTASPVWTLLSSGGGGSIGGSISVNQVAFGSGANTINGSDRLTYTSGSNTLEMLNTGGNTALFIDGVNDQIILGGFDNGNKIDVDDVNGTIEAVYSTSFTALDDLNMNGISLTGGIWKMGGIGDNSVRLELIDSIPFGGHSARLFANDYFVYSNENGSKRSLQLYPGGDSLLGDLDDVNGLKLLISKVAQTIDLQGQGAPYLHLDWINGISALGDYNFVYNGNVAVIDNNRNEFRYSYSTNTFLGVSPGSVYSFGDTSNVLDGNSLMFSNPSSNGLFAVTLNSNTVLGIINVAGNPVAELGSPFSGNHTTLEVDDGAQTISLKATNGITLGKTTARFFVAEKTTSILMRIGDVDTFDSGSQILIDSSIPKIDIINDGVVSIKNSFLTTFFSVDPNNNGRVVLSGIVTASGTTGDQTINSPSGSVNFGIGDTSLTVTNSLVGIDSIIICTLASNDTFMNTVKISQTGGSFTIYPDNPPGAEARVNFIVTNPL